MIVTVILLDQMQVMMNSPFYSYFGDIVGSGVGCGDFGNLRIC